MLTNFKRHCVGSIPSSYLVIEYEDGMFYTNYFKCQKYFQERYGDRTIVLFQKGTFYEIYQYNPELDYTQGPKPYTESIGHVNDVRRMLNLKLMGSDNSDPKPHSFKHPDGTGFPVIRYDERDREMLLSHDYTIVRYDERPSNRGKKSEKDRYIGEIVSPATSVDGEIETTTASSTNQIVSIYIDVQPKILTPSLDDLSIISGISSIDVTTGSTIVDEVHSKREDKLYGIHEIYRFLAAQQPRELIIFIDTVIKDPQFPKSYQTYLEENLELHRFPNFLINFNNIDKHYYDYDYQTQFLNKVFNSDIEESYKKDTIEIKIEFDLNPLDSSQNNLITNNKIVAIKNNNIISELGLGRIEYGLISYLLLLQFCKDHNENLITRLQRPDISWNDRSGHLTLSNNAILQLNILPPPTAKNKGDKRFIDSLISVIDNTSTQLGYRYLRSMILNPLTSVRRLNHFYDMTDELLYYKINDSDTAKPESVLVEESTKLFSPDLLLVNRIEQHMKMIPDLGKLHRKLSICVLRPHELYSLIKGYLEIIEITKLLFCPNQSNLKIQIPKTISKIYPSQEKSNQFNKFLQRIYNLFNIEQLVHCTLVNNKGRSVPSTRPFHYLLEENSISIRFGSTSSDDNVGFVPQTLGNNNLIRPGQFSDIDNAFNTINESYNRLIEIVEHINSFIATSRGKGISVPDFNKGKGKDSDENLDDIGSNITNDGFTTTTSKGNKIINSNYNIDLVGKLDLRTSTKSNVIISSDKIRSYCYNIIENRKYLSIILAEKYINLLISLNKDFDFYDSITEFISILDFVKSNAKTSFNNRYFRPKLYGAIHSNNSEIPPDNNIDTESSLENLSSLTDAGCRSNEFSPIGNSLLLTEKSWVRFKDIRHPIIEKIINTEYVSNDLEINIPEKEHGLLVFGLNSAGKSSLLKAVALNVVMAQAGLYTPSRMELSPYYKLITRLSGDDDLFKGQSSFIVEANEIHSILKNANSQSLVLCDEINRGTESLSGSAIAVGVVKCLIERDTSFLISTHLHQMVETAEIQEAVNKKEIRICRIGTHYDDITNTLIYDRKIQDGQGSTLYGIEVLKALKFDKDFIISVNKIRQGMIGDDHLILNNKKSRYNSKLYIDSCQLCGSKKMLETHHMLEQYRADQQGYIDGGHIHKNQLPNLIVLCDKCHNNLHSSGKRLIPIETNHGLMITIN